LKQRADVQLVNLGLASTRSKAKLLINSGVVYEGEKQIKKAGELVGEKELRVVEGFKFVGRGGLKLEHALNQFKIDINNLTIADIGASTGGFTDCCLQRGAKKIYAIDVGHDQLDPTLVSHPKVINLEKTNIRDVDSLEQKADCCVADLSYISLRLVLKKMFSLIVEDGYCITLFKPQFEAGKQNVGKGGIVKDQLHKKLLVEFFIWANSEEIFIEDITVSPIKGKQGNREFLLLLSRNKTNAMSDSLFEQKLKDIL
jgi:23S rRNA (cytidine1920-2'-O)/16S rRNA (cytidine1409-2'-O)-methyltransferase